MMAWVDRLPPPFVDIVGGVLVHFLWQGALLGILLFVACSVLHRVSAQLRYRAAMLILMASLVLPAITATYLLLALTRSAEAPRPQIQRTLEGESVAAQPVSRPVSHEPVEELGYARVYRVNAPSYPLKLESYRPPRARASSISFAGLLPFVVVLWLAGVFIFSLRFAASWIFVQNLKTKAVTLAPPMLQRALLRLSRKLDICKPVHLLESRIVTAPIVVGWLSPVILLPSKVIETFSLDTLESILAHELAHIHRNDWLVIVLQKVAETLFFYHPVVWWLSRVLEKEREYSCDDMAIAVCRNPRVYAEALTQLELARGSGGQLALAANSGPLVTRIRRLIMNSSMETKVYSPARAVAGSLLMAGALLVGLFGFGSRFAAAQADYNEAPSLAEQVAAGELSPVAERLPNNPLVLEPVEQIGDYGGAWRTALVGGADGNWLNRTIGYENLVRWDPTWTEVIPNVAEAVEVNEDATQFTFRLREGMRWSDGEPFTADDIMFWYEDVFLNEELTPAPITWLVAGDEPVVVEKVDDYAVTFTFVESNALFLQHLSTNGGSVPTQYPRHYFEQFHIDYNPEGIEALMAEEGAASWGDLFLAKGHDMPWRMPYWQNPDKPVLHAWVPTTRPGEGTRMIAERNPYYFKVDSEGNQLPYLDRVQFDFIENAEVLLLRALDGEIDMMDRHLASITNRPVLFDNMERGDYRFFESQPAGMNTAIIQFNLAHNDPVMREIFQNRDFRIGLSYAIDRQEIIDLIFVGQGEPWQAAPRPASPFYNERLATQYTEYDVELANEHLDRAGYTDRDSEGYRLGPDGNRISFVLENSAHASERTDMMELIQGYWREVGIDMQLRVIDRSLFETRKAANEHDVVTWGGDAGMNILLDPRDYLPSNAGSSNFALPWAQWYHGLGGEEPPEIVRQQLALYDQVQAEPDSDRQIELMNEILEIAADEFFTIGISLTAPGYGVVRNNFRNVPESMPSTGGDYPNPGPTNPSQYFLEGGTN